MIFEANHTYHGAVLLEIIETRDGRTVYLIGENHEIEGDDMIKAIMKYAEQHPTEKVSILYESSLMTYQLPLNRNTSTQSLNRYMQRMWEIPLNVNVGFADIRKTYPYDIFEILYDITTYTHIRYMLRYMSGNDDMTLLEFGRGMKKQAKRFEKEAMKHIDTRAKMKRLLCQLVFPEYEFPVWYMRFYGDVQQNCMMKQLLQKVRDADERVYRKIVQYTMEKWEWILDSNEAYSDAMEIVANRRRTTFGSLRPTSSSNMEFVKGNGALARFFLILYSTLQDVYTICHYYLYAPTVDHYIVVAGAAHIQNSSRLFHDLTEKKEASGVYVNLQGKVTINNPTPGPVAIPEFATRPMERLLLNFIERA